MCVQGETLTAEQKRAIAGYLSVARPASAAPPAATGRHCDPPPDLRLLESMQPLAPNKRAAAFAS
jgi:hypothetical protein